MIGLFLPFRPCSLQVYTRVCFRYRYFSSNIFFYELQSSHGLQQKYLFILHEHFVLYRLDEENNERYMNC